MIAADMAPGMNRSFLSEDWKHIVPRKCWYDAIEEANDRINLHIETDIQGYDIDAEALKAARSNAKMAGVDRLIHFQQRAVKDLSHPKPYGFLITNPPYGERLEEKAALPQLYREIGESFNRLDKWSMYLITSYDRAENDIGKKRTKPQNIQWNVKNLLLSVSGAKTAKEECKQMKKVIFATGNEGKMKEIREILGDLDIRLLSLKDAGITADIEENGSSFEENAVIKATAIRDLTGEIVLADDSGLEIDYLNKEPGIYSARYMGEDTSIILKCKSY